MIVQQVMRILLIILFSLITMGLAGPSIKIPEDVAVKNLNGQNVVPPTSLPYKNWTDYHSAPQLVFPTCTSAVNPKGLRNIVINGMACTCDLNTYHVRKRDDYHYTVGIGAHKFHLTGATFNKARKICIEEGGHLAVIDSIAEEQILMHLFNQADQMNNGSNKEQAFIGIHDLFAEDEWVTVLGDSLYKHGYSRWSHLWGGQPDNGGGVQHCGTILRMGGMDDVNCNLQFPFFCEIPNISMIH
ncbi:hemolymph lipopolysaccharide-binding protein [Fopius arisanus]|uniref:Hemolymph lipopolysaccharide-binding protein n=1 Tax=Fopius arisanus TaxID=64838 RepID=A0A0C9R1N6_9HYME|nr:PREDICTED: hemolymph lipopolysaccharide-binding protein-like [Fopius arisanus]